jgi:ATP-dependent RNA helicase DDX51/DBP6
MEDAHDDTEYFGQPLEKLPRTRSPEGTLPSFPLPALPDAPSKSVLALQGLDQALIDAEIVDPARLMTIPDGEGDGGTGLSEKIRKRLKDLGITELFAGMY